MLVTECFLLLIYLQISYHRLISALEERGFIRRLANRARAIEIIKFPEELLSSYNGAKFESEITVQDGRSGQPKNKYNKYPING